MELNSTLADLVTTHPQAARIFHRHRLDFCCGGQRTLAEACERRGLDAGTLVAEIESLDEPAKGVAANRLPPEEMVDFIVRRYHEPLREELPRLLELARKVERVHAEKASCPVGLARHLENMQEEVSSHLAKEEMILFPMIRSGRGHLAHMPVQVMIQEHRDHAENLQRVRELTGDLTLPAEACTSWRALYDGLLALELELMEHIHLENNVLFPTVLAA